MEEITEEVFNAIQEQQKEAYKERYPDISVTFKNQEFVDKVPIKIGDKVYYTYEQYLYDTTIEAIAKFVFYFGIILTIIMIIIKKN